MLDLAARQFVAGEVCEACNGGWLSGLEVLVRPILFPSGGRTILSDDHQQVLAHWFIKTAVVLNTSQNYRLMMFPRQARHEVARGIPSDFGVYIAKHRQPAGGQLNFGQATGAISVSPADQAVPGQSPSSRWYGVWPTNGPLAWADLPSIAEIWMPMQLAGSTHPSASRASRTRRGSGWRGRPTAHSRCERANPNDFRPLSRGRNGVDWSI